MNDLRKYINSVANKHEETVDHGAIWAGIEQKMGKPKKKRRFIPFLLWGVSLSIVAIAIVGMMNMYEKEVSATNSNETKSVEALDYTHQNLNNAQEENKALLSEFSPAAIESNSSYEDIKTGFHDHNSISENTNRTAPAPLSSGIDNSPRKVVAEYMDAKTNSSTSGFASEKEVIVNDNLKFNSASLTNEPAVGREYLEFHKIANLFNITYKRPDIDTPALIQPQPKVSFKTKEFSLFNSLSFYIQYGLGSKTIKGDSEYAMLRNQSEKLLEQLRIGFESDLLNVFDFTLYGGISYASFNDQVTTEESYYEEREIRYLKYLIINPDGTEVEKYAVEDLPHLVTKKSVRYNNHRIVSMPVGFRFGRSISKFSLGVGFGLDINYHLSDTHTVLVADDILRDVSVGGNWLRPSLHASVSVDYPISDRFYLQSNLVYRTTSFKNTSTENEITESYKVYAIDLGVKYQF